MVRKALREQNPSGGKYTALHMVRSIIRALNMATLPISNYSRSTSCFLLRANLDVY